MLYVVDFSVALKSSFDEPFKVQARAFAQKLESGVHISIAPDLLIAEVAQVVRAGCGEDMPEAIERSDL